jgi:hypothetical protein
MVDYVGIKGRHIRTVASDPTVVVGDIWYNNAGYKLKYGGESGSWSSAPTINTGRDQFSGAVQGTTTAALIFGGPGPLNSGSTPYTEQYNGTSWSVENTLNYGRSSTGTCGTASAAVANGGHNLTPGSGLKITELWNGTSWTNGNASNDVHKFCGGGGTQAAGIVAGSPGVNNEFFNGTTWSTENDLLSPVDSAMMNGTQAEAMCVGGSPGYKTATEIWDGTSWSASVAMGTARVGAFVLANSATSVVAAGGNTPPVTTATEMFDGTSWSTQGVLSTARYDGAYGGNGTSGLIAGGGPGALNVTETWAMGAAVKTVTTS